MKLINDNGQISLDFLTAISIFLIALFFVIYSLSGTIPDQRRDNSLYPNAMHVSDVLVKDAGLKSDNDTAWEEAWPNDKKNVSRIGLALQKGTKPPNSFNSTNPSINYVLSFYKVDGVFNSTLNCSGLLNRHGTNESNYWWDLNTTNEKIYKNASRCLGLYPTYNFYTQIRPINSNYSEEKANNKIEKVIPDKETAKVEKIVFIKKFNPDLDRWYYLKNTQQKPIRYSVLIWLW
ncbi:MAG: putative pilin/flagellin [Candidatus Methanohalarchaeum thermophilum]|uniref:Pilin/flagellin n=1 Tax=Methanohalarchaeum thermophilum TaxID=1903181 RepID=A0A1Q6DUS3_METT1|nr:MAG: putative pilin/flagellin [Candidatus Methanohalarchaeum thermophilum]